MCSSEISTNTPRNSASTSEAAGSSHLTSDTVLDTSEYAVETSTKSSTTEHISSTAGALSAPSSTCSSSYEESPVFMSAPGHTQTTSIISSPSALLDSHESFSSNISIFSKFDEGTTSSINHHVPGSSDIPTFPITSTNPCPSSSTVSSPSSGGFHPEQQSIISNTTTASLPSPTQGNYNIEAIGTETRSKIESSCNNIDGNRTSVISSEKEKSQSANREEWEKNDDGLEPASIANVSNSIESGVEREAKEDVLVCEGNYPTSPESRNISTIQETFQDMRQDFVNRHHVEPTVSLSYSEAGPSSGLITLRKPMNAPPLFFPDSASYFSESDPTNSQLAPHSDHDPASSQTNTDEDAEALPGASHEVSNVHQSCTTDSEGSLIGGANPCDESSPETGCDQRSIVKEEMSDTSDSRCKVSGSIMSSVECCQDNASPERENYNENESRGHEQDLTTDIDTQQPVSSAPEAMDSTPSTSGCGSQRPVDTSAPTRRSRSPDTEGWFCVLLRPVHLGMYLSLSARLAGFLSVLTLKERD
ncbi:hypothetical protein FHG87_017123 [Trinorchestia longiramus]|nr:hypothetical protein FHG87_017123 [Trinorchestia longiramus]